MGIISKQLPPEQDMSEQEVEQGEVPDQEPTGEPAHDEQDENDPGYQQALKFAMDALYKGGAAKQIAQQISSSDDVPGTIADVAYNIVTIADEKTNGAVPDELLVLFASSVLKEVADIADASGVEVKSSDLASSMKTMVLRYLGEQGVDTTELQGAMDKVDPAMFDKEEQGESPQLEGSEDESTEEEA